MKKIMIAALGLSLLSGSVVFAQNTSSTTMTKKTKHKKNKKGSTDSTMSSSATK